MFTQLWTGPNRELMNKILLIIAKTYTESYFFLDEHMQMNNRTIVTHLWTFMFVKIQEEWKDNHTYFILNV